MQPIDIGVVCDKIHDVTSAIVAEDDCRYINQVMEIDPEELRYVGIVQL